MPLPPINQPQDVYALMNDIASQATGRSDLKAVDTSSFVSVGETLLRTSVENTLNAISTVLAYTIFSIRPYHAKLSSLQVGQQRWGAQIRKIVNLWTDTEPSQDWNTNLNPNQLADGNSIDMYKIKSPKALQLNFYGSLTLQKHITRWRNQLSMAFRDEAEFMRFIDSTMIEFANEIEVTNEQKSRLLLVNFMTALVQMGSNNVIDLTAGFNAKYGTTYTREQIVTEHLQQFLGYFVALVKTMSSRLTDMSAYYHANLTTVDTPILRHTPVSRQKMIMYGPMFTEAEAMVFPEIFNPGYLSIGRNFETVNFWQAQSNPTAIEATPTYLDTATGERAQATESVSIPFVVGLLYDTEALGIMPKFDYASTTPFNSAGGYYNMYYHWLFNAYSDFTENAILFIMGDGGTTSVSTQGLELNELTSSKKSNKKSGEK